MGRWIELFQDDDKQLSMSRLLCFMSFFPSTIELYRLDNSDALLYYMGAFTAGYVGGKGADILRKANNYDESRRMEDSQKP